MVPEKTPTLTAIGMVSDDFVGCVTHPITHLNRTYLVALGV